MTNMLVAATTLIASKWKSPDVPSVSKWLSKIRYMGLRGKLSAICSYRAGRENALAEFRKQWEPFLLSKCSAFQKFDVQLSILAVL